MPNRLVERKITPGGGGLGGVRGTRYGLSDIDDGETEAGGNPERSRHCVRVATRGVS